MKHDLINGDFADYLNRHLIGIIKLQEKIKYIKLGYEFSTGYDRHSCRLYIAYQGHDITEYPEEEIKIVGTYLYNTKWGDDGNGIGFVSFTYKPQGAYDIKLEEITSFLIHYQFVENLFNGFLKGLLPADCIVEVESLENEPLFIYASKYLREVKYSRNIPKGVDVYKEVMLREFTFDVGFHSILLDEEKKYSDFKFENTVSDKEICENCDCEFENFRSFLVESSIPFRIWSRYTIDTITIDMAQLRIKLRDYVPPQFGGRIYPEKILKYLEEKEKRDRELKILEERRKSNAKKLLQTLINESGLNVDDYILVWNQEIGLIKEFELRDSNQLEITFNVVKKNLQESKYPLRKAYLKSVSYFLHKPEQGVVQKLSNLSKEQQLNLFIKEGLKIPKVKRTS